MALGAQAVAVAPDDDDVAVMQEPAEVGILSLGDIAHAAAYELSGEVTAAVSAHHS